MICKDNRCVRIGRSRDTVVRHVVPPCHPAGIPPSRFACAPLAFRCQFVREQHAPMPSATWCLVTCTASLLLGPQAQHVNSPQIQSCTRQENPLQKRQTTDLAPSWKVPWPETRLPGLFPPDLVQPGFEARPFVAP